MLHALIRFYHPKEALSDAEQQRVLLEEELTARQHAIQRTYQQFNFARDPDMIDATLFELKSHQAYYSYLLRQLRQLEHDRAEVLKAE